MSDNECPACGPYFIGECPHRLGKPDKPEASPNEPDPLNTLPVRRMLKKAVDMYTEKPDQASGEWPLNDTFWIEIEDHSEDGHWSGYAHSDDWPDGYRSVEAKQGVLKSAFDAIKAERDELQMRWDSMFEAAEPVRDIVEELDQLRKELKIQDDANEILTRQLDEVREPTKTSEMLYKRVETLTKELEAYRKAKAENDERFMLERDAALKELKEVKAERRQAMAASSVWSHRADAFAAALEKIAYGTLKEFEWVSIAREALEKHGRGK